MTPEQRKRLELWIELAEHDADPEGAEALRACLAEVDRLTKVEEAAKSDDGVMGDGYRLVQENRALREQLRRKDEALSKWQTWLAHFEPCEDCRDATLYCRDWYRLQDEAVTAMKSLNLGGTHAAGRGASNDRNVLPKGVRSDNGGQGSTPTPEAGDVTRLGALSGASKTSQGTETAAGNGAGGGKPGGSSGGSDATKETEAAPRDCPHPINCDACHAHIGKLVDEVERLRAEAREDTFRNHQLHKLASESRARADRAEEALKRIKAKAVKLDGRYASSENATFVSVLARMDIAALATRDTTKEGG